MSQEKFLLYIDILGFRNLVEKDPTKIDMLFSILDTLNVHKHDAFETTVFSDTILVHNKIRVPEGASFEYAAMFSIEFAHDLVQRLVGTGIFFRAFLCYEPFEYTKLKNLNAYYGKALISAHDFEKHKAYTGLIITEKINSLNKTYPTEKAFGDNFFVFFTTYINSIFLYHSASILKISELDWGLIQSSDLVNGLLLEVRFLKEIYENSLFFSDKRIKEKYEMTFNMYRKKYEHFVTELISIDFEISKFI